MEIPKTFSFWAHKTGNVYQVIQIANEHSTRLEEYPVTVVYKSVDTRYIWSRPLDRWYSSMLELKNYQHHNTRTD